MPRTQACSPTGNAAMTASAALRTSHLAGKNVARRRAGGCTPCSRAGLGAGAVSCFQARRGLPAYSDVIPYTSSLCILPHSSDSLPFVAWPPRRGTGSGHGRAKFPVPCRTAMIGPERRRRPLLMRFHMPHAQAALAMLVRALDRRKRSMIMRHLRVLRLRTPQQT
jgi:hypothetical protein